jgi:hypothetical protein
MKSFSPDWSDGSLFSHAFFASSYPSRLIPGTLTPPNLLSHR